MAGATCARQLAAAGCTVRVVNKSRGVGGRLATRRLTWVDEQGRPRVAQVDHGAPAFAVHDEQFRQFLAAATPPGALAPWQPRLAAGSRALDDAEALWLPQPDMPSLCRHLLQGIPTTLSFAVDELVRRPGGWQVRAAGQTLDETFDAVVLAVPPAQAAPLLAPHRRDWAQRSTLAVMQPCWTLMGLARQSSNTPAWNVAQPQDGPLAWIMRHEARPGRNADAGTTQWVAHARAGWSRQHLEHPPEHVQQHLHEALQAAVGEPIAWQHSVVHRWRYATTALTTNAQHEPACWWDAHQGLGACGDFLGGHGVEGAWRSGHTLAAALLRRAGADSTVAEPFSEWPRIVQAAASGDIACADLSH
jgi:predicted NAD/FAD-dependent oxidoreductase